MKFVEFQDVETEKAESGGLWLYFEKEHNRTKHEIFRHTDTELQTIHKSPNRDWKQHWLRQKKNQVYTCLEKVMQNKLIRLFLVYGKKS